MVAAVGGVGGGVVMTSPPLPPLRDRNWSKSRQRRRASLPRGMVEPVARIARARKRAKPSDGGVAAGDAAEGGAGDARTISNPYLQKRAHHPVSSRSCRFQ